MTSVDSGLQIRFAETAADVEACQRLRQMAFFGTKGIDADRFDACSRHLMIEQGAQLLCTMRLRLFAADAPLTDTYTGNFYDLTALKGPAIEVGRFCMRDGAGQAQILRLALTALAKMVNDHGAAFLFGCTSFEGHDPTLYADAFAYLADHHQGPAAQVPQSQTSHVIPLRAAPYDLTRGLRQMPKLLRSYLSMNVWVGDVAVIDNHMNTMHVFTLLDVKKMPKQRVERLLGFAF